MAPKTRMEKIKTHPKPSFDFGILKIVEPEDLPVYKPEEFYIFKDIPIYERLIQERQFDEAFKELKKHSAACDVDLKEFDNMKEAAIYSLSLVKNSINFNKIPNINSKEKEYSALISQPVIRRHKQKYINKPIDESLKDMRIALEDNNKDYEAINKDIKDGDYKTSLLYKRNLIRLRLQRIFPDDLKTSTNIEISFFNKTIEKARQLKIPLNWKSKEFRALYNNISRRVLANLTHTPNANDLLLKIESKKLKATN